MSKNSPLHPPPIDDVSLSQFTRSPLCSVEDDTFQVNGDKAAVLQKGENKEGVLFLVSDEQNTVLAAEEQQLLDNIIEKGMGLRWEDVGLINVAQHENTPSFAHLANHLEAQIVIVFDVPLSQLGISFLKEPKYNIIPLNGVQLLISDDLEKLKEDQSLKKELWTNLKELFDV